MFALVAAAGILGLVAAIISVAARRWKRDKLLTFGHDLKLTRKLYVADLESLGSYRAIDSLTSLGLPIDLPEPRDTSPGPLIDLFASLNDTFQGERAGGVAIGKDQDEETFARLQERVLGLLQGYVAAGHDDWRSYARFSDKHYVRNMVGKCRDFEMIVICWEPGQASSIHSHGSSHCWMTCLDGCAQERQYRRRAPGEEAGGGRALRSRATRTILPGQIAHINDKIALHSVACPEAVKAPGTVTLHVYAPPISGAKLYSDDGSLLAET